MKKVFFIYTPLYIFLRLTSSTRGFSEEKHIIKRHNDGCSNKPREIKTMAAAMKQGKAQQC
jgi:hypothetical protein